MFKPFPVKLLFCSVFNILWAIWIPAVVNVSHRMDYEMGGNRLDDDSE